MSTNSRMRIRPLRAHFLALVLGLFFYAGLFSKETADTDKAVHLEALVSSNESVRKSALMYLACELGVLCPTEPEPRYLTYGNEIFPYLYQSINTFDDRHARYALEALFNMSWIHRAYSPRSNRELPEEMITWLEKYERIPDPSDHEPLRDALIRVLRESSYEISRAYAAKVLGMSFGSNSDLEEILFAQLVKDRKRRARRGIMEGIAHLVTRDDYSGVDYLSVLGVRARYSYYYKHGNVADGGWTEVLLPNQAVMFERGTGVTLDFTVKPISEEGYILSYRFYDLYKGTRRSSPSPLKEDVVGQVEGNFGATLDLEVETTDLKIESTIIVERVPKCLKSRLSFCFR